MIGTLVLLAATLQARVQTFPLPKTQIATHIERHGNAVWFVSWENWLWDPRTVEGQTPKLDPFLGRIDARGRMKLHALPKGHMPGLTVPAPDGTLWLSDIKQPVLWHVLANGRIESVKTDRPAQGIAFAGGDLWCTHVSSATITRYGTNGAVKATYVVGMPGGNATMMSMPPPPPGPHPIWIVRGPDGAVWFTEPYMARVGRITMSGEMTLFPLPKDWREPGFIVAGPDGALWFTVSNANVLGRITTEGDVTSVDIRASGSELLADDRGRIWYIDYHADGVGFIDTRTGEGEYVTLPEPRRQLRTLTRGPDGALWSCDQTARAIVRIELLPSATPPGR